jgi:HSP20 family molecular chaperone IbpA
MPNCRRPHVEQEGDSGPDDPEEAAHGYDCRMSSRRDTDRLRIEMEELFADLCQARLGVHRAGFRPRVDVFRTEDPPALNVVVELAGVDPVAVELAVVDGVLVVSGRRRRPAADAPRYQHMEIDYGAFERRILLGDTVDADGAAANYEHGLLTVVLPLAGRTAGPVRLRVSTGGRA